MRRVRVFFHYVFRYWVLVADLPGYLFLSEGYATQGTGTQESDGSVQDGIEGLGSNRISPVHIFSSSNSSAGWHLSGNVYMAMSTSELYSGFVVAFRYLNYACEKHSG